MSQKTLFFKAGEREPVLALAAPGEGWFPLVGTDAPSIDRQVYLLTLAEPQFDAQAQVFRAVWIVQTRPELTPEQAAAAADAAEKQAVKNLLSALDADKAQVESDQTEADTDLTASLAVKQAGDTALSSNAARNAAILALVDREVNRLRREKRAAGREKQAIRIDKQFVRTLL